ncbi:hypothetical protein Tco_1249670 [Tanacetum coccineum]
MTRMMYNWIMRRKLDPMENLKRGVRNFTRRIKGMHVFVGISTYATDFMIVKDISSIIDPRLSQVVLGKPFVEIFNISHDPPEGVVRCQEDKRRDVEYVMSKILGFYKECLELGPEYVTGMYDEGEVTNFIQEITDIIESRKFKRKFLLEPGDGVKITPDSVFWDDWDSWFLALGWHLEEIHVTWAHLEKKRTRLQTYTKSLEELCIQRVETTSQA